MTEYGQQSIERPYKATMTGPEHYDWAEELVHQALSLRLPGGGSDDVLLARLLAAAQVHATLAQTSATVLAATVAADMNMVAGSDLSDYSELVGENWRMVL